MKILNIHSPEKTFLKKEYKNGNLQKMVRFLPSIQLFRKDKNGHSIYLVSYRIWRAPKLPKQNIKKTGNQGTPWHGERWWNASFDGTAYFFIKIHKKDPTQFKILKEFVQENGKGYVDMRILYKKQDKNKVYYDTTFNRFLRLNPKEYANNFKQMDSKLKKKCFYYVTKKGKLLTAINVMKIFLNAIKYLQPIGIILCIGGRDVLFK
jgi:hypothetical protein